MPSKPSEIAEEIIWGWDCMKTKGSPDPERVKLARAYQRLREAALHLDKTMKECQEEGELEIQTLQLPATIAVGGAIERFRNALEEHDV